MPRKTVRTPPGDALKTSVLAAYELEPHELLLLDAAAKTADTCAELQAVVDRDGPLTAEGRPRPALVELRLTRLTLGRLLAALRIPTQDKELPARPVRGFYGKPRSVS